MQNLFYIPEKKEDIEKLINEIYDRNINASQVVKMDFMYVIALLEEYYQRDVINLKSKISYLRGGRIK